MGEVRYPVIVLEGADCVGKTTLADAIMAHSGARYVHMTYRFKKTREQFLNYQWAAMELCLRIAETSPVVLDRWWPSDEVYGAEFRDGPTNPLGCRQLDRVAMRYGFLYVFCCPSDSDAHVKRHFEMAKSGREMYNTQGNLLNRYRDLYSQYERRHDFLLYDMDTVPLDRVGDFAESVYEVACDHRESVRRTESQFSRGARYFSGNSGGGVLLVGDFTDCRTVRRQTFPLSGRAEPSAWWLRQMSREGIREEDLCYFNSNYPRSLAGESRPPPVVHPIDADQMRELVLRSRPSQREVSDLASLAENKSVVTLGPDAYDLVRKVGVVPRVAMGYGLTEAGGEGDYVLSGVVRELLQGSHSRRI